MWCRKDSNAEYLEDGQKRRVVGHHSPSIQDLMTTENQMGGRRNRQWITNHSPDPARTRYSEGCLPVLPLATSPSNRPAAGLSLNHRNQACEKKTCMKNVNNSAERMRHGVAVTGERGGGIWPARDHSRAE